MSVQSTILIFPLNHTMVTGDPALTRVFSRISTALLNLSYRWYIDCDVSKIRTIPSDSPSSALFSFSSTGGFLRGLSSEVVSEVVSEWARFIWGGEGVRLGSGGFCLCVRVRFRAKNAFFCFFCTLG